MGRKISEASTSSSSPRPYDKLYDVFISFRGADTRQGFTSFVRKDLDNANLRYFYDDKEIDVGLYIKPEIESGIRASRASIIVLSENYATSKWCLNELVLILEQHRDFDHIVIPIFYHVVPADVKKQQKSFGVAMKGYKEEMEKETNADKKREWAQRIKIWENALTSVADLAGKVLQPQDTEASFVEKIVTEIYHKLGLPLNTALPVLFGMDDNIKFITSWLKDGSSHTVDILTISGIGGIGKTSLAEYVFKLYCREFSRSSFVENIGTICKEGSMGLRHLRNQLCRDISKTSSIQGQSVVSVIENALATQKVFLVLDDIDSYAQLDAFLGKARFHPGSKIIITTKDKSVTRTFLPLNSDIRPKHSELSLTGLHDSASLELLCFHAFECAVPNKGFEKVSDNIVKYTQGHPLALVVSGKSLKSNKPDVVDWEDYLGRLKEEPIFSVQKVLETSIDSLLDYDKELFKYIACFFVGEDRDFTETVLNECLKIETRSRITNLIQRGLVSFNVFKECKMHSLIQVVGRSLVRKESENYAWERSRFCDHEESLNVLKERRGIKKILGLSLDLKMLNDETVGGSFALETDTLSKMKNLKILVLNHMLHINGSFENFPQELRWLRMHGFPLECIPSDLKLENLVALDMSYSKIKSFDILDSSSLPPPEKRQKRLIGSSSRGKRSFGSLKDLNLSFCEQLLRLGGFSELPALERLVVANCILLAEVCESVEQCVELSFINFSYCRNLKNLPTSLGKLKKVKTLLLDGCNLHEAPSMLKSVVDFPPSSLVRLSLAGTNLTNESFPVDFSCLANLLVLILDDNPIRFLPPCVGTIPKIEELHMNNSDTLETVEHPPRTLKVLHLMERYFDGWTPFDSETVLRKIVLHPGMSTLKLLAEFGLCKPWSIEIEGVFKTQSMSINVNLFCSLAWISSEKKRLYRRHDIQVYYEFGIFSTLFERRRMPKWVTDRNEGQMISFTIPSSPKKVRGLNFCNVQTFKSRDRYGNYSYFKVPSIKISNVTKNVTWIYNHVILSVYMREKFVLYISHWMFGANEMEADDQVTITVMQRTKHDRQLTEECGISLVYEDDDDDDVDENDGEDDGDVNEEDMEIDREEVDVVGDDDGDGDDDVNEEDMEIDPEKVDVVGKEKEMEEKENEDTSENEVSSNDRDDDDYRIFLADESTEDEENESTEDEENESTEDEKDFFLDDYLRTLAEERTEYEEEEEDPLSKYKSWNNIIGKDLSAFQSPTGEYILENKCLSWCYVRNGFGNYASYSIPDADSSD